jgi:hypothetical protein
MKATWTIAFVGIAATLSAEELPRKTNTPRETYPNVDVIYDFATAPDGKRLRTIVTKPRNAKGKLPVIFIAAWLSCDSVAAPDGTKDEGGLVFRGLAQLPEFALFRMDKQGVGDSEGVCAETDFESELAGYRAAFRALKNYDFIDAKRIYILGISNGGGLRHSLLNQKLNKHKFAAIFQSAVGSRPGLSTCSRSNDGDLH